MVFRMVFIAFAVSGITISSGNDGENNNDVNAKLEVKYECESNYAAYASNAKIRIKGEEETGRESDKEGKCRDSESEGNSAFPVKREEGAQQQPPPSLKTKEVRLGKPRLTDLRARTEDDDEEEERVDFQKNEDVGTRDGETYHIEDKLCRVCNVKFRLFDHYEDHFVADHPYVKPYSCPCCIHEVVKRQNFLNHIKSAHPGKTILRRKSEPNRMYECEECFTEHRGAKDFEKHNAVQHKGMKMIKCGLCDAKFAWFSDLAKHEIAKHGIDVAEFQCKFCGVLHFRSDVLEKHVMKCEGRAKNKEVCVNISLKEYRTVCYECGQKFQNMRLLMEHFRFVHKCYSCFKCKVPTCQKKFNSIRGLEMHSEKYHADAILKSKRHRSPSRTNEG